MVDGQGVKEMRRAAEEAAYLRDMLHCAPEARRGGLSEEQVDSLDRFGATLLSDASWLGGRRTGHHPLQDIMMDDLATYSESLDKVEEALLHRSQGLAGDLAPGQPSRAEELLEKVTVVTSRISDRSLTEDDRQKWCKAHVLDQMETYSLTKNAIIHTLREMPQYVVDEGKTLHADTHEEGAKALQDLLDKCSSMADRLSSTPNPTMPEGEGWDREAAKEITEQSLSGGPRKYRQLEESILDGAAGSEYFKLHSKLGVLGKRHGENLKVDEYVSHLAAEGEAKLTSKVRAAEAIHSRKAEEATSVRELGSRMQGLGEDLVATGYTIDLSQNPSYAVTCLTDLKSQGDTVKSEYHNWCEETLAGNGRYSSQLDSSNGDPASKMTSMLSKMKDAGTAEKVPSLKAEKRKDWGALHRENEKRNKIVSTLSELLQANSEAVVSFIDVARKSLTELSTSDPRLAEPSAESALSALQAKALVDRFQAMEVSKLGPAKKKKKKKSKKGKEPASASATPSEEPTLASALTSLERSKAAMSGTPYASVTTKQSLLDLLPPPAPETDDDTEVTIESGPAPSSANAKKTWAQVASGKW